MTPFESGLVTDLVMVQKHLTVQIAEQSNALGRLATAIESLADTQAGLAQEIGSLVDAVTQQEGDEEEGKSVESLDD
jgi:hypothetical protein